MSYVFRVAVMRQHVHHNPVRSTQKYRKDPWDPELAKPWNLEEMQQVREALVGTSLEPLVMLAASTGLRFGELLALKWSRIDFNEGTLLVEETVTRQCLRQRDGSSVYRLIVGPPKTKSGIRKLSVFASILDILRLHHMSLEIERIAMTKEGRWQENDLVFPNKYGGYAYEKTIRTKYYQFLETNGIRRIRIHDIRHTFATLAIEKDPGLLPAVSKAMGHSSVAITLDRYGATAEISHHATLAVAEMIFPGRPQGANADRLANVPRDPTTRPANFFEQRQ
jgi:integrase